jgi:hypothetical protein
MCKRACRLMVFAALVAAAGCGSSPTTPAASTAGTASIGAPKPLSPATGAQIKNSDQPLTLIALNAFITQAGGTTYTYEVAGDSAFNAKIQTKDGVAEGANGSTSVKLDPLPAASDYYWHVRASGGGTTGVFGPVFKFTIGPAISITAPVPIAPLTGTQTTQRPTLRVTNSTHLGPVGAILYKIEISTSSTFASTVATATVPESVNETDFTPTADLPAGTLFWRATAIDSVSGVASQPSVVQSFTAVKPSSAAALIAAQLGQVLWPGAVPSGANGQAIMGDNCDGPPPSLNWAIATCYSVPTGQNFLSPTLEALRYFDLFDRGYDPPSAMAWMMANGYPTIAQWYPAPAKAVLGVGQLYLAARFKYVGPGAIWDIVSNLG